VNFYRDIVLKNKMARYYARWSLEETMISAEDATYRDGGWNTNDERSTEPNGYTCLGSGDITEGVE